jgi:hypothetical protein
MTEPVPLSQLSDEQLAELAAGVNAELYAAPQGTPGHNTFIKQWERSSRNPVGGRPQAPALRRQLKKIDTSQNALMAELEEIGGDADPAAVDYRQRIRDRAAAEKLAELQTQATEIDDPALLDAVGKFTSALPEIREALYNALDVQILYRSSKQLAQAGSPS